MLSLFTLVLIAMSGTVQVEVPGPRGRPSTIVDKDEDLGKVMNCSKYMLIHNNNNNIPNPLEQGSKYMLMQRLITLVEN